MAAPTEDLNKPAEEANNFITIVGAERRGKTLAALQFGMDPPEGTKIYDVSSLYGSYQVPLPWRHRHPRLWQALKLLAAFHLGQAFLLVSLVQLAALTGDNFTNIFHRLYGGAVLEIGVAGLLGDLWLLRYALSRKRRRGP